MVAEEIQSLAEKSQRRAADIEASLDEIKSDTSQTVGALDESDERVADGIEEVDNAMETSRTSPTRSTNSTSA